MVDLVYDAHFLKKIFEKLYHQCFFFFKSFSLIYKKHIRHKESPRKLSVPELVVQRVKENEPFQSPRERGEET